MDSTKYGRDAKVFSDPVVRCDSCTKLILTEAIHTLGKCPHCGNRRIRNVLLFTEPELAWMKKHEVDPEFLAIFEPAPEVPL